MALSNESSVQMTVVSLTVADVSRFPERATTLSDRYLILAAQSGCRTAFSQLWDLHSSRIYRTALSITRNAHDAEDALQDCFLRAFLSMDSFEGRASFYTWLTRIAINSALGILRKRRRRTEISLDSSYEQEAEIAPREPRDLTLDPEQLFEQQQTHEKLMQAIHRLPATLREAVQTHMREECSLKDLAYQLKISHSAAKSRLYRARLRLGATFTACYGSRAMERDR